MIKELLNKPGAVEHFARLDFSNNKELKDLLLLTAEICETQLALITFIVGETQLLKVRIGTDLERTSTTDSFCRHINNPNSLLMIPDALEDERFSGNPLVIGGPGIRFYAGAPLCTDSGEILGSLCVLDNKPQQLDDRQQKILMVLSKQAYRLMELELNNLLLKQHAIDLEEQKKELMSSSFKLKAIFESSHDCFMLLDHKLDITAYNHSLANFVKKARNIKMVIGINARQIISASLVPIYKKYCEKAFQQGKSTITERKAVYSNGNVVWWRITFNPAFDAEGNIIGVTVNAKDISERKEFEEKILVQNASLRKIAFIQSHELRRPLANILGLVSVLKLQNNHDEIHAKLETSALELDERLHYAVKYAEDYDPVKKKDNEDDL